MILLQFFFSTIILHFFLYFQKSHLVSFIIIQLANLFYQDQHFLHLFLFLNYLFEPADFNKTVLSFQDLLIAAKNDCMSFFVFKSLLIAKIKVTQKIPIIQTKKKERKRNIIQLVKVNRNQVQVNQLIFFRIIYKNRLS